jgi:hypothetical protein
VAKRINIPGLPEGPGPRDPMDVSIPPITITVADNVENRSEESNSNLPPPQPLPMTDSPIDPNA